MHKVASPHTDTIAQLIRLVEEVEAIAKEGVEACTRTLDTIARCRGKR